MVSFQQLLSVGLVLLASILPASFAHSDQQSSDDLPILNRLELIELVRAGNLATLNQVLTEQQSAVESGAAAEHVVDRSFRAFSSTEPAIPVQVAIWKRSFPESFAPYLALARHHVHVAWLYRGTATASETSRERFTAMQKHLDLAVVELKAAIALRPQAMAAHSLLVWVLNAKGLRNEAIWKFYQAVEIDSDSVGLHETLLRLLSPMWGGSFEAQLAAVAQMREVFSDHPEMRAIESLVHYDMALAAGRNDELELALEQIEKAVELRSGFLINKAGYEGALGRKGDALLSYARLLELDPYHPEALEGVAWLFYDTPAQDVRQRYVDRLLQIDPLDPRRLTSRAEFHLANGRRDLAIVDLDNAMIYGALDRNVLITVSRIFMRDKTTRFRGKQALERMLELYPDDLLTMQHAVATLMGLPDCDSFDRIDQILEHYAVICREEGACSEAEKAYPSHGEGTRRFLRKQCVSQVQR